MRPHPTRGRITALDAHDIRFPTSRRLEGSDAMQPAALTAPGFSAAMRPESLATYAFPGGAAWQGPFDVPPAEGPG
ncbi:hypothetical protein GCM10010234_46820 [Streptomyces hawaiiensis]